jgi:putative membrane protein
MSRVGPEEAPRGEQRPYDGEHGTRRTRLANERTYLAWWRTGLAAFAVSIGAGRLVPAIAGGPQTLYSIAGILFALIGIVVILYGRKRARDVDAAISAGRYHPADDRMLSLLAGLAAAGGLLLVALILVGR